METKQEYDNLIITSKAVAVFVVICGVMLLSQYAGYNKVTVALMYLATALYVFLFFKKGELRDKGYVLYFYAGLMYICIVLYQEIYMKLGIIDSSTGETIKDVNDALYFSIVTWTTLGYGDFKPSPEARFFAASQAMLGYIYMSILVAKLFSWMRAVIPSDNQIKDSNK